MPICECGRRGRAGGHFMHVVMVCARTDNTAYGVVMALPIEDYAVLGDMDTAALVRLSGLFCSTAGNPGQRPLAAWAARAGQDHTQLSRQQLRPGDHP